MTLEVTVDADEGADKTVIWVSSDEDVATITQAGELAAVAVGSSTITATSTFDNDKYDSIDFTVFGTPHQPWITQNGTSLSDSADAVASHPDGSVIIAGTT